MNTTTQPGPLEVRSSDQLGGMVPARLTAKPIDWEQDEENQWSEKNPVRWGFYIVLEDRDDELEPPEYRAYWGESDGETCATLDEAKAWCQKTADDFIADAALVTPNVELRGAEQASLAERPSRTQGSASAGPETGG